MNSKTSVAIIGQGFVGGSLATVMAEKGANVYVYDKGGTYVEAGTKFNMTVLGPSSQAKTWQKLAGIPVEPQNDELSELEFFVQQCEKQQNFSKIYFVCVPTPMFIEDGEADTSIVESVLTELANIKGEDRIAVVKSTVPPGSTERWNKMFASSGLHVVFNPEFLTESNAIEDMRNQNRIVLGGPRPWINAVKQVFQSVFPDVPIVKTSSTTAEMVKYFTNIQLATRVVLSCEFAQLCNCLDAQGLNIDYDKVVEYARFDKRLGDSHMSVPGKNGLSGARGHCFPKDLAAIVFLSKTLGVDTKVMQAVQSKNLDLVPPQHRDWEQMTGRAVSTRKK